MVVYISQKADFNIGVFGYTAKTNRRKRTKFDDAPTRFRLCGSLVLRQHLLRRHPFGGMVAKITPVAEISQVLVQRTSCCSSDYRTAVVADLLLGLLQLLQLFSGVNMLILKLVGYNFILI